MLLPISAYVINVAVQYVMQHKTAQ